MSFVIPNELPRFIFSSGARAGLSGVYSYTGNTASNLALPDIANAVLVKEWGIYFIKNKSTGGGVLTITNQSSDTVFDAVASAATFKLYPGDGVLVTADNGNWVINSKSRYSGITKSVAADISQTSTTTLANVTNMVMPVALSEEVNVRFTLNVGAALSTTGVKVAVTAPSGATLDISATVVPDTIAAGNTLFKKTTTSGTALDFATTGLVGVGDAKIVVDVWCLNSTTAGNIQLQTAQSTSSGTALTVRKGSTAVFHRIA